MSFCSIRISLIGNNDKPNQFVGTNQNGQVIEEKWDNGLNRVLTSTSMAFSKYKTTIDEDREIIVSLGGEITVYFTDSRIIVLCRKFDRGNIKWEFVSSDKSDKKKQKGKVLLGQVRYEWLQEVGYKRKAGFLTWEGLSLTYLDGERYCNTYLVFPKGTDMEFLANDVLRRACRYRLTMKDPKNEYDVSFFRKYLETGKIGNKSDPKELASVILPNSYTAPLGEQFRPDTA